MRLPSNLGSALGQGFNQAFADDPGIDQNYARSRELSQQAIEAIGKLGGLSAPEPVRPAYRTEDVLGLLLGGLLSGGGREIAPMLAGFQQGKLGRAQQDTETKNQRFNQQADSIQRQGAILGQQSEIARKTGDDLLGAQNRKRDDIERRRNNIETAGIRRSELEEKKRKATLDGLIRQVNGNMTIIRSGGPAERVGAAQAIEDLVKKNPEYAEQLLTYRDPLSFSTLTPLEALNTAKAETENTLRQARLNKINGEVKKLASGVAVDEKRVLQLAENTRLMKDRVANQTAALRIRAITGAAYAANVAALIDQRGLNFELDLAKNAGSTVAQQIKINESALTATGILLNAAQKRMDAMKAQKGDQSKEYLEAVEEYNAHNATKGELEDTRTQLAGQVANIKTALDKSIAAKVLQQAKDREAARAKGVNTPFTPGVDTEDPRASAPAPKTGGNKPSAMKGNGFSRAAEFDKPSKKNAMSAAELKRIKSKAGPGWNVTSK
jgi:hypothetical protein